MNHVLITSKNIKARALRGVLDNHVLVDWLAVAVDVFELDVPGVFLDGHWCCLAPAWHGGGLVPVRTIIAPGSFPRWHIWDLRARLGGRWLGDCRSRQR